MAPTQETGTTFKYIDYNKDFKINERGYMTSYCLSFHNEVDSVMHDDGIQSTLIRIIH